MANDNKKQAVYLKNLPNGTFIKGMTLMQVAQPSVAQVLSFLPVAKKRRPFWWWLFPFSYITRLEYDCATAAALAANLAFSFANESNNDMGESSNEREATKH